MRGSVMIADEALGAAVRAEELGGAIGETRLGRRHRCAYVVYGLPIEVLLEQRPCCPVLGHDALDCNAVLAVPRRLPFATLTPDELLTSKAMDRVAVMATPV
jgi:hypothetical protein